MWPFKSWLGDFPLTLCTCMLFQEASCNPVLFCYTACWLIGSTSRSYLIHSPIASIWVADRKLTFHLSHDFPSRISLLAKMPVQGATSRACCVRGPPCSGQAGTRCTDTPAGIHQLLGEAKLTVSCSAASLWIIFISAVWLLSSLSLSFQIDAVIQPHCRNPYLSLRMIFCKATSPSDI